MSRDPGYNTVTTIGSADIVGNPTGFEDIGDGLLAPTGYDGAGTETRVAPPWDALADPSSDDLIHAGRALWPQGPAWGTPDGAAADDASLLTRFTRVLLSPFEALYARAFSLTREASVTGVNDTLENWEADYGLPGPCGASGSREERLRALEAAVIGGAIITPADFIALAYRYGFRVTLEEPAMFECGFSECGGGHELGDPLEEVYVIVTVLDLAVDYFVVGEGELGETPLFSLGEAERMLCILRQVAPGWVILTLNFE